MTLIEAFLTTPSQKAHASLHLTSSPRHVRAYADQIRHADPWACRAQIVAFWMASGLVGRLGTADMSSRPQLDVVITLCRRASSDPVRLPLRLDAHEPRARA